MMVSVPKSVYARASRAVQPSYLEALHPKQQAFVLDQSRRKVALCGRRAGKSYGLAAWFLDGMEKHPRTRSLYVTLTRPKAKQIMWDKAFLELREKYSLPIELRSREGQLMVEHKNGSSLWLLGCDDQKQVDKVRGEAFLRAAVDEAQAFPDYLKELVEDAIHWSLMDLQGELAVTGTPSPVPVGYFHDISSGMAQGWEPHHWTILDNAHLPHGAAELERTLQDHYNGDESNPTYQREGLGRWVHDLGALIYPFDRTRNGWSAETSNPYGLPDGEYRYGLGIDLGFSESSTAFCLAATRVGTGEVYVLSAYTRSRLIPTALAVHAQAVREQVTKETRGQGLTIVVDEGALGRGYAEQMRTMGVGCIPAEKLNKRTYQEYVRGLILSGACKVDYFGKSRALLDETSVLQFDPETGTEDERYTRHCADAFLYIVRHLLPRYEPEENEPERGSPEWYAREQKRLRAETMARIERKRRGDR